MQNSMHLVTRAVILKKGKLLVCVSPRGSYFLPGGHVEQGESAAAALERELQEELGAPCAILRFLGCLETDTIAADPHGCHHVHSCHSHEYKFVFLVDVPELSAEVPPQSPEVGTAFQWIPLETLGSEIRFQPHALGKVLAEWVKAEQGKALVNSKSSECKSTES